MKRIILITALSFLFFCPLMPQSPVWQRAQSLGPGLNLTNFLSHIHNPQGASYTQFTEADLAAMEQLGVKHVRIPVGLHYWTASQPPYAIDTTIFQYLDTVLHWASRHHLKAIIDYHNFIESLWGDTLTQHTDRLCHIWKETALRYRHTDPDSVFFELYNEPGEVTRSQWIYAAQRMIDTIRSVDTSHTLIVWIYPSDPVDPSAFADDNLIYTFHFYHPPLFTHQGSTWQAGGVRHTVNVPFPYNPATMPPIDPLDIGTPHEAEYYAYPQTGTVDTLLKLLNRAGQYMQLHNVPLYCGEFGNTWFAPVDSKVFWLDLVRKKLDSLQVPWAHWGWKKGMMRLFDCTDCFDLDSVYTDSAGYTVLCALGLAQCNPVYVPVPGKSGLKLFPNPTTGQLYITGLPEEPYILWVTDVLGRIIYQQNCPAANARLTLDLEPLERGYYLLHIHNREIQQTIPFVKG